MTLNSEKNLTQFSPGDLIERTEFMDHIQPQIVIHKRTYESEWRWVEHALMQCHVGELAIVISSLRSLLWAPNGIKYDLIYFASPNVVGWNITHNFKKHE